MRKSSIACLLLAFCVLAPTALAHAQSVADVIPSMGPCQSHLVTGLSDQLLRAQVCSYPDSLVAFSHPNISPGSGVNQYGSPEMVAALLSVAAGNHVILNDAFRTVVIQYAYVATDRPGGDDGCYGPASPGTSRHEWGNAIDVENSSALRPALLGAGFVWQGDSDPVHYTTGPERRGGDVLTFQHLWNLNHPEDVIDEDGIYGPQTEARLRASPAAGFPVDGCSPDADGDGFHADVDCDEASPTRHPGATETCDAVDEDCDGMVDEALTQACDGACGAGTQTCAAGAWGACVGALDPGVESCDEMDEDCDGEIDEGVCDAGARDGAVRDGSTADGGGVRGARPIAAGCGCVVGAGPTGGASYAALALVALVVLRRRARTI